MRQIGIVAGFALLEHSRKKLMAFFIIISLLVIVGGSLLTIGDEPTEPFFRSEVALVQGISQGVFGFLATLAALVVSATNFNQTFKEGEAALVLSRPVTRWHYALGRMLAASGVAIFLCAVFAAEIQMLQIITKHSTPGILWPQWGISAYNLVLLLVIASLYSSFIPVPLLAGIAAYLTQTAVGGIQTAKILIEASNLKSWVVRAVDILYYITPKPLSPPVDRATLPPGAERFLPPANSVGFVVWSAAWLVGLVLLTIYLVNRKEV